MNTRLVRNFVALALMITATAAPVSPLGAQGAPPAIQLAFGYECGDRFLVRNDGTQQVALEWKTTGSRDKSQLHLNARQSLEIASASNDPVELWVNGKVVATEKKGNSACNANSTANALVPEVVVRPLDANSASQTFTGDGDPPSRVARISSMQGGVSFQAAGAADWGQATLNYSVTTGDRLVSDDGGRAELEIGPVAVRFSASTDVIVTSLTDGLLQLGVSVGTVRLSVYRLDASDSIEVDTPNGAVTVMAPGNYLIATNPAGTQTTVSVEKGRAELSGPNLSRVIEAGRTVRMVAGDNRVQVFDAPKPGPDGFDSWSSFRDSAINGTSSTTSEYVNPDIPGAQDLDANGRWENDATNGPTWYPTAVVADWVPYRYGHWAWIEPWGWTWIADEPWGYAPFHYGRWAFARGRWGWLPGPRLGRPYYAPALVAFADGGGFGMSIGVSAWFPLGPRDPFLPWYHHDDFYLRRVNERNVRNVADINIFVHVTNRENIHYANRNSAMTVVPTTIFAGGRPVGHDIVRVTPERIAQARITPHPGVVPTRESVIGRVVVPRPAIAVERHVAMPINTPPIGIAAPPMTRRPEPPTKQGIQATPRPLVIHAPVPPPAVPFEKRQAAIADHPGRPLEPQQIQNLRAGRPAGPQRDPEPLEAVRGRGRGQVQERKQPEQKGLGKPPEKKPDEKQPD